MAILKSLTIHKLYDVEPTTLHFHPKRNVLLGKNGTGKTRLLNLISMILRSDLSEMKAEEFDIEFRLGIKDREIAVHVVNERKLIDARTPFPSQQLARQFQDRGTIEITRSGKRELLVRSERGQTTSEPEKDASFLKIVSVPMTEPGSWFRFMLFAVDVSTRFDRNARRFDEALDVYRRIFTEPSSRPVAFLDQDGGFFYSGFFPFGEVAKWEAVPAALSWDSDNQAFLGRLAATMGFDVIRYSSESLERLPAAEGEPESVQFTNFGVRLSWADGSFISHEHLSYGQKRMLAFAHYVACNPDVVIADELVNGLHHEWIEFCLNEIGDRQAFLTSQNPLLFDYLDFDSPEDVKSQFVLCSSTRMPRRRTSWTQMSDEKAAEFHGAYKRGVQYVSEILQTEGLW